MVASGGNISDKDCVCPCIGIDSVICPPLIADVAPPIVVGITVENFMIATGLRHTNPITIPGNWCKIGDDDDEIHRRIWLCG